MFRQSGSTPSSEVLVTTGGGGGGGDVNLTEVGGAAIALGQAAMVASLPVVLASNQSAVPVSGPLTDTQLRATPIPVSGTVTTGGLTDTQLRATPVPVSGTVTANAGTNLNTSALATEATLSTLNSKVTAVNTGAVTISAALPAGNNNIGDVDVATLPALVAGTAIIGKVGIDQTTPGTTNLVALAANQSVNVAQVNGVTPLMGAGNTGTGSPRVTIATDQAVLPAQGNIADDATTPGNPVMIGGKAKSPDGTDPGSVSAEDDTARAITDLNRRVYVNTDHPRSLHKHLDGSSAYTDSEIAADPGDGFQIIITNVTVGTGAATAFNFFFEEGSTKVYGPYYLEAVAGRGFCSGPIHLPITPSTNVTITTSASIAQAIDIDYFIQAV